MNRFTPYIRILCAAIAILLAWWLVAKVANLPYPGKVGSAGLEFMSKHIFWTSLSASITRWLAGVLIGLGVGSLLACISAASLHKLAIVRGIGICATDTIAFLRAVPIIGLPSILILVAGIDEWGKIFVIAWGSTFVFWMNLYTAIGEIDEDMILFGRGLGMGNREVLRSIIIPMVSWPAFVGVRHAAAVGWLCIVAAEYLGVIESGVFGGGLGFLLWRASNLGQIEECLALLSIFGLLGWSTDFTLRFVGGILFPYREEGGK